MKKIVSILLFVMLVALTACGGGGAGDLMSKLPAGTQSIATINVEKAMGLEMAKGMMKDAGDESLQEILKVGDNAVIGIVGDAQSLMGSTMSMNTSAINYIAYISGEGISKKLEELAKEKGEEKQDIDGTAVYKLGSDASALIINDNTLAIVAPGKEKEMIKTAVKGENTIDTNSAVYKKAKSMNGDICLVTDLSAMEPINISELMPIKGIDKPVKFGMANINIVMSDSDITTSVSVDVEENKIAKSLADGLNEAIPGLAAMAKMQINQMPDEEIKKDLNALIDNLKLNANGKSVETSIKVKTTTLEKLAEMGL